MDSVYGTRSHFTFSEHTTSEINNEVGSFGYFGGGGPWDPWRDNFAYYTGGGSGYFMFKKEGTEFTIYKGDENGVDESSTLVGSDTVGADNYWYIYGGINHYGGSILMRDFELMADTLISVNGSEIPADWNTEPVPEPATMLLLGSGLIGLVGFRRRFKK